MGHIIISSLCLSSTDQSFQRSADFLHWGYLKHAYISMVSKDRSKQVRQSYRHGACLARFQYPIRRLIVRSHKLSEPRDLYLELSDRPDICPAQCGTVIFVGTFFTKSGSGTWKVIKKKNCSRYWHTWSHIFIMSMTKWKCIFNFVFATWGGNAYFRKDWNLTWL